MTKMRIMLNELGYWHVRRRIQLIRPWLAKFYPKWVITDALIHAGIRKTLDSESVVDVPFITIYERWYKEGRRG